MDPFVVYQEDKYLSVRDIVSDAAFGRQSGAFRVNHVEYTAYYVVMFYGYRISRKLFFYCLQYMKLSL